ncbi:TIGR00266 family protein [Xanthobacter sp. V3C-3]|uniref:TIGR00266 family protein n=1 Tax=Xanthobacter lutulentifluminis TaxID=3119935 RepID=UPI003728DCF9
MRHEISGTTLPVLSVTLEPGETILAETDRLSWMTSNVAMRTTTGAGGGSGLFGAIGRALGGGGLFMTEFTARGGAALVAFAATVPGSIFAMPVAPGRGYLVHRHGFLAGAPTLAIGVAVQQSLGVGVFGGDGFVLQHITGEGTAFLELGGEIVSYTLEAGQDLLVHPGHVGMFEESVSFEITTVPGVKTMLFGGDGLFLARLSGPGKVWFQSLTPAKLAHALAPYLPAGERR